MRDLFYLDEVKGKIPVKNEDARVIGKCFIYLCDTYPYWLINIETGLVVHIDRNKLVFADNNLTKLVKLAHKINDMGWDGKLENLDTEVKSVILNYARHLT